MRHRYYLSTVNGALETTYFSPEDFRSMGLIYVEIGMPQLEALELLNKWNRRASGRYSYWLGEGQ